ncbi:hypothetical protein [Pseudorhodoferax sp. Leaf274]|uniref:hypothetical protein n=1 Tax=Pseudorhodoferax sp. Leaf274 TaxID=1736318 RepID=UPI000702F43B|nr:hypothetical protein [Pseudorhodoferax sp. Leaf274]KQP45478.1 hypothetical protein ASF44_25235 [Pseudorhodoferax sp. Leaf274]
MPDQTPSMPPLPEAFGFHSGFAWMSAHGSECHIALKRQAEPGYEKPLYTAEQAQAVADERVREALERGFEAGWRIVARDWAMRDDLISDIGSPAYIADRDRALEIPIISLAGPK